jgi:hypothetical protein
MWLFSLSPVRCDSFPCFRHGSNPFRGSHRYHGQPCVTAAPLLHSILEVPDNITMPRHLINKRLLML